MSHGIYYFALSRTFMNESGKAARALLAHVRRNPDVLAVFHDDADLAQGTVAIEFGRGAAGHHGVLSIIQALGSQDFWRVRIGIRPPTETARPHGAQGRTPAGDFVLTAMSEDALGKEATSIDQALKDAFPKVFSELTA
jgi:PTH1 family peptidyl-tRNA hydrolase